MKLLLASKEKFLLEKGYDLLGISRENLKIGIITTGLKASDEKFLEYIKEYMTMMKLSGIDFKEFDIDGRKEAEIRDFFKDRNLIQVIGGNPFFLLKKVRESGFDTILKDLIKEGYLYIGCSSGSQLMTPSIEVGAWKEGRDKFGVEDLTTLGYVPFLIKSHYTDDKKEEVREKMKTLKYPLKILTDHQAILVEDCKYTFVGDGEEVVIQ